MSHLPASMRAQSFTLRGPAPNVSLMSDSSQNLHLPNFSGEKYFFEFLKPISTVSTPADSHARRTARANSSGKLLSFTSPPSRRVQSRIFTILFHSGRGFRSPDAVKISKHKKCAIANAIARFFKMAEFSAICACGARRIRTRPLRESRRLRRAPERCMTARANCRSKRVLRSRLRRGLSGRSPRGRRPY